MMMVLCAGFVGTATETEVQSRQRAAYLAAGSGQCRQDDSVETARFRRRQSHHTHTGSGLNVILCRDGG